MNPWTQRVYERGSAAFDRVVFFSDAVFAIALTLVAVEIGIPEVADDGSVQALWGALLAKWPALLAFAFTFFWVAFYWRANHAFTVTLRAVDGRYIATLLGYLAFIALLPFPAATLGEYTVNPVALAFFAVWVAAVSGLEVALLTVAHRRGLFVQPLGGREFRGLALASLAPVAGFVVFAPLVLWSIPAAALAWVVAVAAVSLARRRFGSLPGESAQPM